MSMLWSLRLFEVAGTTVRVHFTFFLLLAWIGALHWSQGGASAAIDGIVFIILLFTCVVLHEFGHAFAARRFGIKTPEITVLPIGGVARLERMPEKPMQEIIVALAGPAVNVVIALVLILFLGARFDFSQVTQLEAMSSSLIGKLAVVNVVLVLFNLIPAFPMDGGRVLRALLALKFGYVRATQIAAAAGQALAVGFGFIGLFGNPLLVLVALFIYFAASAESRHVEARELARGFLASDAMITSFESLSPSSTADDAADLLLRTTQREFPVLDGAQSLRGFVTREGLVDAIAEKGGATPVLDIMQRDVPSVGFNACLETVLEPLQDGSESAIAVLTPDDQFKGYITAENFAEMMMLRKATDQFKLTPGQS